MLLDRGNVPLGLGNIREPSFAWLHNSWASLRDEMIIVFGAWRRAGFHTLLDPEFCDRVRAAAMESCSRVACPEEPVAEEEEEVDLALWPNPNFPYFKPKEKKAKRQAPKRQR
jgi:hypothetical protein